MSDVYPVVEVTPYREDCSVAVSGDWKLRPRAVRMLGTEDEDALAAVRRVLRKKGLRNSSARIVNRYSIDMDGDGRSEEVIYAETKGFDFDRCVKGQYSFVMLRWSKARESVVDGEFYREKDNRGAPIFFWPGGIWDVDGDGRMEIVAQWRCPEASSKGVGVYRVVSGKVVKLAWELVSH